MEKSFKNSFTYMLEDRDCLFKLSILIMFQFALSYITFSVMNAFSGVSGQNAAAQIPSLIKTIGEVGIIYLIISVITCPFIMGYMSVCTHNVINYRSGGSFLPNWEDGFFNYYSIGTKYYIGLSIAMLVMLIPGMLTFGVLLLVYSFLTPAFMNIFCQNYETSAFFSWKKAFNCFTKNKGLYFKIIGACIVFSILCQAIMPFFKLLNLPIFLEAIIFSIITTYSAVVFAYMIGLIGRAEQEENSLDEFDTQSETI